MNDNLPTSKVLNLAANAIEEHGWVRGPEGMRPADPGLCLMGGIAVAIGAEVHCSDVVPGGIYSYLEVGHSAAANAVATYLDWSVSETIYDWNDNRAESAEQVIATLRAAALIEAAKEQSANLVVFDAPTLAEAEAVAELVSR